MSNLVFAYLAGVVDADGTIGIKRSTYAMRIIKDCAQAIFSERVCVKQVEPQAVNLLHSQFGGYRFVAKPSTKMGRPLEGWQVTDLQAAACLKALRPYLRIKHAQALNCLALRTVKDRSKKTRVAKKRSHAGSSSRSAAHSAEMERLYEYAHTLNRVGVRR